MEIIKIAGIAIVGVMMASLLKSLNKDISIYIILATVIVIFISVVDKIWTAFTFLEDIYDNVTYGKTFLPVILKVLATAYVADFTAQLCRDAGETAIASKVEMAGKVVIFCMALPIFTAILELINSLLL